MALFDEINQTPLAADSYRVDITYVIDGTGSMQPVIDEVKNQTLAFDSEFKDAMSASGKNVDLIRTKVIVIRDFKFDGALSLEESPFFSLPDQAEDFHDWVGRIEAKGGGDAPESTLEGLAAAMRSDWTKEGTKRRHTIVLFTDAPAVPLNDPSRTSSKYYPKEMPKNLAELSDMFQGSSQTPGGMPEKAASRLILFAPDDEETWNKIGQWNYTWHLKTGLDKGCDEVTKDTMLRLLVNSTTAE